MKKKIFHLISGAFLLAFALVLATACGEKSGEKKVLKMATEATFPPYEYRENGEIKGIDVDIVREIAKRNGYTSEVIDMKFDAVITSVQTKKADIAAAGITVTEDRRKMVDFSIPYVRSYQSIILLKSSGVKSKDDLARDNFRIGVQQGTTGDAFVTENYKKSVINRFDNGALAVAALRNGKVDAVVLDGDPAKVHVGLYPTELRLLDEPLTEEAYALAISKDRKELLEMCNKTLLEMQADGTISRIMAKHKNKTGDGENAPAENSKTLKMATEATFPPYEYMDGGEIKGIDVDIVRTVASRLGYNLEVIDMKFDAVITAVQTKKADIAASGITVTEDRKKMIDFTHSYVQAYQLIIVRHDSDVKGKNDLHGKTIGVQQGTTGDSFVAENYKDSTIDRFDNGALAVAALRNKKVDAVVLDGDPAKVHVSSYSNEIKLLDEPLTEEQYAFAIAKDNKELLQGFNRELKKMLDDGSVAAIIAEYKDKQDEIATLAEEEVRPEGLINKLKAAFYTNFVKDSRYMYLVNGFGVTLIVAFCSVLLGIILGFIVAVIRSTADLTGKLKILNWLCKVYLTVIRGTPVVVQLLIIYFVIFSDLDVSKVLVAILAFGINSGAYVAEIIRSGIMSIDRGQMEAGRSLGLSYTKVMVFVILPQAFKNVLPALGNEFIVLLKETSVAGYIALQDLTKGGEIIRSQTYDAFMPLIAVAVIYLVVVILFTKLLGGLEKRLKKNE